MNNCLVLEPTTTHRDMTTNAIRQEPFPAYKRELKPDLYKGKLPGAFLLHLVLLFTDNNLLYKT